MDSNNTFSLPTGPVSVSITASAVSIFEYETALNEAKRTINILNNQYVDEVEQELIKLIQTQSSKKRLEMHGNPFTGIRTEYNFDVNKEFRKKCTDLANSPEAIQKKKEKFKF